MLVPLQEWKEVPEKKRKQRWKNYLKSKENYEMKKGLFTNYVKQFTVETACQYSDNREIQEAFKFFDPNAKECVWFARRNPKKMISSIVCFDEKKV